MLFSKYMKIRFIPGIDYDSNIYFIDGKKPTIIDCGTGINHNKVIDKIRSYTDPKEITQIILTHEHFDHVGGIKKLKEEIGENVKIISHKLAAVKIESGKSNFARMLGAEMKSTAVDTKIENGQKILIGNEEWDIYYTPGHSPGCISLYEKNSKSLISGDTIFAQGYFGRYDLPGGSANLLKKSISRLSKLDIENLYPGHENIVEKNAEEHIKKTLQNIRYI